MSQDLNPSYEEGVLREANLILKAHAAELQRSGLRPEVLGLQQSGEGTELTIYFWRGDELMDAIEFFVSKGGVPVASEAEVNSWLAEQVRSIAGEHRLMRTQPNHEVGLVSVRRS